jgi:hypothetical protein
MSPKSKDESSSEGGAEWTAMMKDFRADDKKNKQAFYGEKICINVNQGLPRRPSNIYDLMQVEQDYRENAIASIAKLKVSCILNGRCPQCTLILPCKHFS